MAGSLLWYNVAMSISNQLDSTQPGVDSSSRPPPEHIVTLSQQRQLSMNIERGYRAFLRHSWLVAALVSIIAIAIGIAVYVAPLYGIVISLVGIITFKALYVNNIFISFAKANNFYYQASGLVGEQTGILFFIGFDYYFENIVYGWYEQWPFYVFTYTYSIGDQQQKRSFHRTVMTINYVTPLPAFLLRKHKLIQNEEQDSEAIKTFGYTQTLELEGNFGTHFQVFIRPNTQDDVLTLLTPDIMVLLIRLDSYEIEMTFAGDFYVYCSNRINSNKGLLDLYNIVEAITAKIGLDVNRKRILHEMKVNSTGN